MKSKINEIKPGIKLFLDVLGRFIYIISSSLIIIFAGGGLAFLDKPIGVIYLILWISWWTITFIGRQRGKETEYNKGQKILVTFSGFISVPFLIIIPSLEYFYFDWPIPRDGFLSWVGLTLFVSGILMQSIAMWQLRGSYTVRIGIQPEQHLAKTGLYRLIRHPGYLSYIISIIGIGLSLSSLLTLIFVVFIVYFILWRIKGEEEMLLVEFGDEYKTYMNRTKRLMPFIY